MENSNLVVGVIEAACGCNLRIQRKSDVVKMGGFGRDEQHRESREYEIRMSKIGKKVGRTGITTGLIGKHYKGDPNKGYPKGFIDHDRYDPRHH